MSSLSIRGEGLGLPGAYLFEGAGSFKTKMAYGLRKDLKITFNLIFFPQFQS